MIMQLFVVVLVCTGVVDGSADAAVTTTTAAATAAKSSDGKPTGCAMYAKCLTDALALASACDKLTMPTMVDTVEDMMDCRQMASKARAEAKKASLKQWWVVKDCVAAATPKREFCKAPRLERIMAAAKTRMEALPTPPAAVHRKKRDAESRKAARAGIKKMRDGERGVRKCMRTVRRAVAQCDVVRGCCDAVPACMSEWHAGDHKKTLIDAIVKVGTDHTECRMKAIGTMKKMREDAAAAVKALKKGDAPPPTAKPAATTAKPPPPTAKPAATTAKPAATTVGAHAAETTTTAAAAH